MFTIQEFWTKSYFKTNGKRPDYIEVNRQILAKLLALPAKHNKAIDFELDLKYLLCPVPQSLSHPDGSRRKTAKFC